MAQRRLDGQELENANAKAKADFLKAYEGATVTIRTQFYNRQVIRAYKRTFAIVMRNWFLATNIARAHADDKTLSTKIEAAMLRKIEEVRNHFRRSVQQCDTLIEAASLDVSYITHETAHTDDVKFLGPVAGRFREVLLLCDRYLDLVNLLWTFGEIDERAHGDANYDVRNRLRGIETSVRNHWIGTRKRLNDDGKSRPNFKAGSAAKNEDDAATTEGAAAKEPSEAPVVREDAPALEAAA